MLCLKRMDFISHPFHLNFDLCLNLKQYKWTNLPFLWENQTKPLAFKILLPLFVFLNKDQFLSEFRL